MINSKYKLGLLLTLILLINLRMTSILGVESFAPHTDLSILSLNQQNRFCQNFVVIEMETFARKSPSNRGEIITSLEGGEIVCVLLTLDNWYIVDLDSRTIQLEIAFVFGPALQPFTGSLPPPVTPVIYPFGPSGF